MAENRTLHTSRVLPFSPKAVFSAFASADMLASWWGPAGFSSTFDVFEFVEGGRWQFTMHAPDGTDYLNDSVFDEIVPEQKIVIHHVCPPYFRLTVDIEAQNDGTLISWRQQFDNASTAQAIKRRAGSANEENLDRLAQVLGEVYSVS